MYFWEICGGCRTDTKKGKNGYRIEVEAKTILDLVCKNGRQTETLRANKFSINLFSLFSNNLSYQGNKIKHFYSDYFVFTLIVAQCVYLNNSTLFSLYNLWQCVFVYLKYYLTFTILFLQHYLKKGICWVYKYICCWG